MFESLLENLGLALAAANLPYVIIGGQAVLLHGEPRLTRIPVRDPNSGRRLFRPAFLREEDPGGVVTSGNRVQSLLDDPTVLRVLQPFHAFPAFQGVS